MPTKTRDIALQALTLDGVPLAIGGPKDSFATITTEATAAVEYGGGLAIAARDANPGAALAVQVYPEDPAFVRLNRIFRESQIPGNGRWIPGSAVGAEGERMTFTAYPTQRGELRVSQTTGAITFTFQLADWRYV